MSLFLTLLAFQGAYAEEHLDWQKLSKIGKNKTHIVPAFWGGLPTLRPKAKVKVLDAAGPGVVTSIHFSAMSRDGKFESPEAAGLIFRVFYDRHEKPAIEMPLMDFAADIEGKSQYFASAFMSKVKESHNFFLPMPFHKHIVIEVENPAEKSVTGYLETTYDEVESIPEASGYLHVDYRKGYLSVNKTNELFQSDAPGVIVAHWLQYEGPVPDGALICEADQQLFLDGDTQPTIHSMGTEDVYGLSWGFNEKGVTGLPLTRK